MATAHGDGGTVQRQIKREGCFLSQCFVIKGDEMAMREAENLQHFGGLQYAYSAYLPHNTITLVIYDRSRCQMSMGTTCAPMKRAFSTSTAVVCEWRNDVSCPFKTTEPPCKLGCKSGSF